VSERRTRLCLLSAFPGKINHILKIQKGNAEPMETGYEFMSRSSRGLCCGLSFGLGFKIER